MRRVQRSARIVGQLQQQLARSNLSRVQSDRLALHIRTADHLEPEEGFVVRHVDNVLLIVDNVL